MRTKPWMIAGWLVAAAGSQAPARAAVVPAALFADNMVPQQGASLPVWGMASADEQVTGEFLRSNGNDRRRRRRALASCAETGVGFQHAGDDDDRRWERRRDRAKRVGWRNMVVQWAEQHGVARAGHPQRACRDRILRFPRYSRIRYRPQDVRETAHRL